MISPKHRTSRTDAFTMVELIVVIALIAIVGTLVISVGSAVRGKAAEDQSRARLTVLNSAIQTFHATMNRYPGHVVDWRDTNHQDEVDDRPIRSAQRNMHYLLEQLRTVEASRMLVDELPTKVLKEESFDLWPDAVYGTADAPYDDDPIANRKFIVDLLGPGAKTEDNDPKARALSLNYQATGGRGRSPVVISAGANGVFGDADDLRSDDA